MRITHVITKKAWRYALLMALLLVNSTYMFAQSTVTGVVTDASGEPLIGVNVLEKGTTNGTITGIDGDYTLRVAQGKTLVFSYIGYITQEVVVRGSQLNVTLQDDTQLLEDVVVIGYGSMTRKDVTSSITTVMADQMNVGAFTSPSQLLQGKVPGLTITNTSDPNGSGSISLRGASSLREGAAMEPYYVIDGVPGVSLSLIAPEDIESIDVLRDATATAIYGSKAANGVIIVTTKKGSKGEGHSSIGYSGYVAIDNTLKTLDMMSASQLLSYAKTNNVDLSPYYDASNPADTDWQKEVLRTGISHSHNLSINGGHGNTNYSASVNYINKEGVIRGTDMNRLTARSFLQTSALNDRLDLSFSVNASITNKHQGPTGTQGQSVLDAMYYYNPLVPVKNADGTWYKNTTISQNFNPLSMVYEDVYGTEEKLLQGVAKVSYEIIDGLTANGTFSYQNSQDIHNNYDSSLSQLPTIGDRHGQAQRYTVENIKKQMELYANYDHTFGAHKLGLMAGYSWEQNDDNDGFGLTAYNFYNDKLSYYNIGLANSMDIDGIWSAPLSTLRMISFYGRVNYSYNSKYLFQATIRRDGSSAFGKNNRWGTFPSASLAWRITEEDFMKDQNVISDLKLRVGYGVSGNSLGFDAYTAIQTYGATGWFTYTDPTGASSNYRTLNATSNTNPDLKWEKTGMFNVGLDFGFANNRINGTIEYYSKKTSDLIYGYPVSTNVYPYPWMTANVGEISNKGIEFSLNVDVIKTRDFNWATTINLSHNKNRVEKLSNATFSVDYINEAITDLGGYSTTTVQRIMEGAPIGQFYLWEWAGYSDGKSIFNDYDENGNLVGTTEEPDETDRRKAGSAQPTLTYSWNNTISYKNWSLTAFFQGVAGNKIFNATRAFYNNVTLMNTGKNMMADVATEQLATDTRAQAPSDRYLENGAYFRLASLTLAYNVGKVGKLIDGLRIYATCNNVFTLTGYKGVDPEINLGGLTPGMDWRNSTYPRTRSFLFGLSFNLPGGKTK
ncbi:MAG: TonB-dependent receptor [Bacteroidaceae bacterium]|nr:TonB-dependent receptor [Bacteroidaceae bacterium]